MADTRFIIIGIALVFAGLIVLGAFGGQYQSAVIESDEFGTCYEYNEQQDPISISCSDKMTELAGFFGVFVAIMGAGAVALAKGARGDWDSRVKPEDMVGPGAADNDSAGVDGDGGSGKRYKDTDWHDSKFYSNDGGSGGQSKPHDGDDDSRDAKGGA